MSLCAYSDGLASLKHSEVFALSGWRCHVAIGDWTWEESLANSERTKLCFVSTKPALLLRSRDPFLPFPNGALSAFSCCEKQRPGCEFQRSWPSSQHSSYVAREQLLDLMSHVSGDKAFWGVCRLVLRDAQTLLGADIIWVSFKNQLRQVAPSAPSWSDVWLGWWAWLGNLPVNTILSASQHPSPHANTGGPVKARSHSSRVRDRGWLPRRRTQCLGGLDGVRLTHLLRVLTVFRRQGRWPKCDPGHDVPALTGIVYSSYPNVNPIHNL